MLRLIQSTLLIMIPILVAACGYASGPKIAERPDAIITFDGARHTCVVSLVSEQQGSSVKCGEVASFMKDELRLPAGAVYDVRTVQEFDHAEMVGVGARLKEAGYRFIGGRRSPLE